MPAHCVLAGYVRRFCMPVDDAELVVGGLDLAGDRLSGVVGQASK